ncbi:MAG: HAMP domain-containing protein, partial [Anaerolineales bacterium]
MKTIFKFFSRLQWKLTFSYAFVTISTVIVLAALAVGLALFLESRSTSRTWDSFYWSKTAFQDNIPTLLDDPEALQAWLERVHAVGFFEADLRSYSVRESLDYANTYITGTPIYLLDPNLNVITAAPADESLKGKPFPSRLINGLNVAAILEAAQTGDKNYYAQSLSQPDGSRIVAFPLRKSDDDPVVAIVLYQVRPFTFATPSNLEIYSTFFLIMTFVVLAVSLPVGAIFGWLASRGLRKRLVTLAAAAQAWSRGDFSVTPRDKSGDEIGELTRALNRMAEQLQTHVATREELTR